MKMKIYNTLTRKKEEFKPIKEGEVSIYVCGPTVYNFFHIGNARPFVVFDTLRKYMEYRGNKVKFVQNFTDVDDKIINKAREEGSTAPEVSEKYIEEYYKDAAALNVRKADVHPKVSEHIQDIVKFVETLVEKVMPMKPTAMCISPLESFLNTANCLNRILTIWSQAQELQLAR